VVDTEFLVDTGGKEWGIVGGSTTPIPIAKENFVLKFKFKMKNQNENQN